MDYKEKYEQALERAKVINPGTADYEVAVKIFPELKKSEDEKLKEQVVYAINQLHVCECTKNKLISWIEEKCEQKSADKVEPKFKVGDWIYHERSGNTFRINKIENDLYVSDEGATISLGRQNNWRLWTIQDAEDGDVLSSENPFIFRGFGDKRNPNSPTAYCGIDLSGNFILSTENDRWTNRDVHPATKEQHNLLFKKMEEAGYEWDAEKKELKKVEQKPNFCHHEVDLSNCSEEYRKAYYDGWNNCNQQHAQLEAEQKLTWNEEDENMLNHTIDTVKLHLNHIGSDRKEILLVKEEIDWLKSLKERVRPKQEWSEEDERIHQCLIKDQEKSLNEVKNDKYGHSEIISDLKEMYRERIDWLKSLKQRNL